jgi:hypothetical protein
MTFMFPLSILFDFICGPVGMGSWCCVPFHPRGFHGSPGVEKRAFTIVFSRAAQGLQK